MRPRKRKKKKSRLLISSLILVALISGAYLTLSYFNIIPKKYYTAKDFNIITVKSQFDKNANGIDDYTDILVGARLDAKKKPKYKSAYYTGGYPPFDEGVCTDLVWRAFSNAGYSLKDMVDEDIKNNVSLYPRVEVKPDTNIDFRRVKNLKVFFDRKATSLSLDPMDIAQWQAGDIVVFGKDYIHIAIVSDKRNRDGVTYIIHNAGQPMREEDALVSYAEANPITGHYRFENDAK